MNKLEQSWRDTTGGGGGSFGLLMRGLLKVASFPYQAFSCWRNAAYARGWLSSRRPAGPFIISVGNVVTGGTGKTPFVLMLAQELQQHVKLAILSRGYRSQAEKARSPQSFFVQASPFPKADLCGDEPALLMRRLPPTLFVIGPNRCRAADIAAHAGAELLLLDDAFQHRRLARDIDIALVDAYAPFGNGSLFPRGSLRESPEGLARAHLIVINHISNPAQFRAVSQHIARYSSAPVIGTALSIGGVYAVDGKRIPCLEGVKVGLFCGICHPERFQKTVQELGAQVVATLLSSDHRLPDLMALELFAKQCQQLGASWIVCTEKDLVKLPSEEAKLALPIASVRVDLKVVENLATWQAFLKNILADRQIGRDSRCV